MSLHFDITGDNSNFLRKLDEARNGIRSTSKQIEESGTSIEQMFGRMAKGAAALGAGFSAQQFASQVMKVRGEFQQLEVAFNTMLGSEEKANALMQQLVKTAATTPFDLQSVAGGAKQLLAYGTAADDVNGTLIRLGDIAAGLSIPLGDLVYLYGTTMAQGRLYTQDFNQFTSRGIPMISELAKQFGVAESEVKKLVESGKVGFPEVQKVIESLTNEGGKFGGLMEAQSKTITGQISNIEDAISGMFNKIGQENEGLINEALSGVSYLVENWESVATAIESAAIAYGTYKAATMTASALQGAEQTLKTDIEIEGLNSLLRVKEESKNADLAAAVASGKLTEAKAAELIALRAELASRIAVLKIKEEEALVEEASALSAFNIAQKESDATNDKLEKMNALYEAALSQGDASYEQYAMEQLQTASANANTAATNLNTAERNLNTAASNRRAASEAVGTVVTQANTVANHANTASMNIMKLAAIQLTTVLKGMWATLMANPLMLVIGALAGLAFVIYKVATAENEAETATRMYNEAIDEQQKKQEEYKEKIDALIKTIDDNNKSEGERLQAFEALKAEYPTVLNNLLTEAEYLKDVLKYKKLIAEEDNNRGKQSDEEILEEAKRKLKDYQNARKNGTSTTLVDTDGNGWATDNVEDAIKAQQEIVNKALIKVSAHDVTSYLGNIKDLKNSDISSAIDDISTSLKALGKSGDDAIAIVSELGGEFSKSQLLSIKNALETEQKSRSGEKKAGTEWLSSYKKAYEDADKAYNDFLKSKQVMLEADRDKELKRLKELRDTAKTTYEAKGGSASSDTKQESAAEKLRKEQEKLKSLQGKQSKDSIRQAKDLEFEAAQAKISAMQEGSEKSIAQMNLDHKKEIETLKRNREDYLQKKIEAEKAIFEADPSNKGESFDSSTVSLSKDEKGMFKNLLESTISQQGNELAAYYKEIFSKYQGYTEKRLAAQKKFQEERDALVKAGASKETLAENDYQRDETFKSIDNEFAMREDSFEAWADNIADLSLEKLRELLVQAERELERSEFLNPKDPKLAGQRAKVTSLKNTISEKTAETNTSPNKRSQKEWQDLYKTLSKVENEFEEIGEAVGGTAGEILSAAGSITASTLKMIDGIVSLSDSSAWAIASTATAAEKAIKAVEKASVILAIIGAAMKVASEITQMISGESQEEIMKRTVEYYNKIVDIYDQIIDKQKESIKFGYGFSSIEAATKAMDELNKKTEYNRKIADVSGKSGISFKNYAKEYERLAKEFGLSLTPVFIGPKAGIDTSELSKLTGQQLEYIRDNYKELWAGLRDEQRDALQAIIDAEKEGKEVIDAWQEAITGISYDSFYTEFIDTLSDMDSSAEDMAENFGEYLKKSILAAMVAKEFKGKIDELYQMWVDAGDKKSDGGVDITKDEALAIQEEQKKLTDAMIKRREEMEKVYGWENSESTSQDSTKGMSQSMDQDTGNELNGRFTAFQISNEEIKNQGILQSQSLNILTVKADAILSVNTETRNIADETRTILANSYLELVQISENTGAIIKPIKDMNDKLDKIEKNTSKL